MEVIDKDKLWRYMNISDCIHILCQLLSLFFFPSFFPYILGGWVATFVCSGLGLRRYCKGKPMMMYGTINDEEKDDHDGIMSSYYHHLWTVAIGVLLVLCGTVNQFLTLNS